jgi:RNA polymerase sigma-70 factor, ECF subfamily
VSDDAEALATTFREEWPRLVAAALRITGDLQMAEDAAQDAFLAALDKWALAGVPERPGAWLMTVCRNRARNAVRDAGRAGQKARSLRPLLTGQPHAGDGPRGIADDRLRLTAAGGIAI